MVFAGCGSAVLGAAFPQLGIGVFGIARFRLTVVTMVYAIGHISGRQPAQQRETLGSMRYSEERTGVTLRAESARRGRSESPRSDHVPWDRPWSETTSEADRGC